MNIEHVHSMYSAFDSTADPEDIVKRAKELGCNSITLTDHDTLLGIEPFMEAGAKYLINTIPGVEMSMPEHLVVFAKNYAGYQAISYAMRDANLSLKKIGKHIVKPLVSKDVLKRYFNDNPNIIATSACIQGPIAAILLKNRKERRNIEKNLIKAAKYANDYTLYAKEEVLYKELKEKISATKKQITQAKRDSSDAILARIDKCKAKIEYR